MFDWTAGHLVGELAWRDEGRMRLREDDEDESWMREDDEDEREQKPSCLEGVSLIHTVSGERRKIMKVR